MPPRRPSSFFKILLDASAPHLPLPPDFASRHLENRIPKNPIIRSAVGGHSWSLKIKKIGESYCFSSGWDDVVADIHLGFGDFLVFQFDHKSTFKMLVYSPNGCEKVIPQKVDDDSGSIDVDDDLLVEDDDVEVEEDEIEVEDDEIEAEVEDDDDDDEDEDEEEYEEEKEDGDDDEEDGDDDEVEDGDGGGDIDGHDGDPFFMSIMSETNKNVLRLPTKFVHLVGIDGEGKLTLKNLDGKEWETGLRREKWKQSETYCVSAGWDAFRRSNGLCDGDECVFKFITSEGKLLLAKVNKKVTKKSRRARKKQPSGETPATEVVKRKRGQLRRNAGGVPASKVEKRGRGRVARDDGGGVEVESDGERVEVVKRSRGRPFKRQRGRPARQQ